MWSALLGRLTLIVTPQLRASRALQASRRMPMLWHVPTVWPDRLTWTLIPVLCVRSAQQVGILHHGLWCARSVLRTQWTMMLTRRLRVRTVVLDTCRWQERQCVCLAQLVSFMTTRQSQFALSAQLAGTKMQRHRHHVSTVQPGSMQTLLVKACALHAHLERTHRLLGMTRALHV